MKTAVLAAIGDELLGGARTEANCSFLARSLSEAGWNVRHIEIVSDEDDEILDLLARWVGRTDLLVMSGGLGPTHDDRTRGALARYLGCGLRAEDDMYDRILAMNSGVRREVFERTRDTQSVVPEAADAVFNPEGSALGISFTRGGTRVLSFPGVPVEFAAMARQELADVFTPSGGRESVTILGIPEIQVVERIPEIIDDKSLHVSVLPSSPTVELIVSGDPRRTAEAVEIIRERFSGDVLPKGCSTLAEAILHEGRERGLSVSCAESCTGGLLQGALTAVPGSSDVFTGGVVSYSNEVKINTLGVPRDVIEEFGAVSRRCAEGMARGVMRLMNTDFSVSITGVAGPDGGSAEKPVGGVWFGIAAGHGANVSSLGFYRLLHGDRANVRKKSVNVALAALWRTMTSGVPCEPERSAAHSAANA